jgi:hypothetical protein
MSVLKPCVYCGGTDFSHMDRGGPICHRCTGTGSTYRPGDWNTRAPDWQDISTAPRDGTYVLLASENGDIGVGYYFNNQSGSPRWRWQGEEPYCALTHWMPLPAPPKEVG